MLRTQGQGPQIGGLRFPPSARWSGHLPIEGGVSASGAPSGPHPPMTELVSPGFPR